MPEIDEDDEIETLASVADAEIPTGLTLGAGGAAPLPVLPPDDPPPPKTPEHHVCLRGPCRYFHTLRCYADVKTTVEGFVPEETVDYCTVSGRPVDITGDNVLSCSKWDPETPDHAKIERRKEYLAANPNVVEADNTRVINKERHYRELREKYERAEADKTARDEALRARDRLCSFCHKAIPTYEEGGVRLLNAHVHEGKRCPGSQIVVE